MNFLAIKAFIQLDHVPSMLTIPDAYKIADKLRDWYLQHKRDLPWRETNDPYKIWLSEVILQQTRVAQGHDYYLRFIESYPTVQDLAAAREEEVLRLWQGLGYYSRARNLHACAKTIVSYYEAQFPERYEDLMKLKGIGAYTAAAIASFAFGERVPVVDGNVFRVLSRLFGVETDISSSGARKEFFEIGKKLITHSDPAIHNQAMMEFGALQCTPAKPNCMFCTLQEYCVAFRDNRQSDLPVKLKKAKVKNRYFYYFVVEDGGRLLLKSRGPKDIWQGLYDFPLYESASDKPLEEALDAALGQYPWLRNCVLKEERGPVKHLLSHQKLHVRFLRLGSTTSGVQKISSVEKDLQFYDAQELSSLPKPILIDKYLRELNI